jgi:hypothetical protein
VTRAAQKQAPDLARITQDEDVAKLNDGAVAGASNPALRWIPSRHSSTRLLLPADTGIFLFGPDLARIRQNARK